MWLVQWSIRVMYRSREEDGHMIPDRVRVQPGSNCSLGLGTHEYDKIPLVFDYLLLPSRPTTKNPVQ
jgi:hypothetical protein